MRLRLGLQPHNQLPICNTLKVVSDMSAYHDLPVKYRYAINKEKRTPGL